MNDALQEPEPERPPPKPRLAPRAPGPKAYCPRCDRQVRIVPVWKGWRYILYAWYGGIVLVGLLLPIIMTEIMVLLPLATVYAAASGTVHSMAEQKPTCRVCGLGLPRS